MKRARFIVDIALTAAVGVTALMFIASMILSCVDRIQSERTL